MVVDNVVVIGKGVVVNVFSRVGGEFDRVESGGMGEFVNELLLLVRSIVGDVDIEEVVGIV